jgi:pentatricopeptide repeat protein
VATFTVFFMAFTAMVGKELMEIDYAANKEGKLILSTYFPTTDCDETASETATATSADDVSEMSDEEKEGVAEMKSARPAMGDMFGDSDTDAAASEIKNILDNSSAKHDVAEKQDDVKLPAFANAKYKTPEKAKGGDGVEPRKRFRDSLNALQIEEAKATGRAQLGLAFEMLTMMKKRALKADPEAYQCLIDACGRVGDTKRATDLLAKMHEDGIVADGTVYACLVSAFSADTAWRNGTKEEDLPGKRYENEKKNSFPPI